MNPANNQSNSQLIIQPISGIIIRRKSISDLLSLSLLQQSLVLNNYSVSLSYRISFCANNEYSLDPTEYLHFLILNQFDCLFDRSPCHSSWLASRSHHVKQFCWTDWSAHHKTRSRTFESWPQIWKQVICSSWSKSTQNAASWTSWRSRVNGTTTILIG